VSAACLHRSFATKGEWKFVFDGTKTLLNHNASCKKAIDVRLETTCGYLARLH